MRVRVKKDIKSFKKLLEAQYSLPTQVVEEIAGKVFDVASLTDISVPARLDNYLGVWSIPFECVEVIDFILPTKQTSEES